MTPPDSRSGPTAITARDTWPKSEFEWSWVDRPPSTYGLQDAISWEFRLTNNTDRDLNSSGQRVYYDSAGGLTLDPVAVPAGETVNVAGGIETFQHSLAGAASAGTYTLNIGVAGPGKLFSVPVEVVEGSILDDQPTANRSNFAIVGCEKSTSRAALGETVNITLTVENAGDVDATVKPSVTIGEWGWTDSVNVPAGEQRPVTLDIPMTESNLSKIGGEGEYEVIPGIMSVDAL